MTATGKLIADSMIIQTYDENAHSFTTYIYQNISKTIIERCVPLFNYSAIGELLTCSNGSVEEIAKKRGLSMAQISTAWILSKEGVSAPIIGSTSIDNLKDAICGYS